MPPELSMHTGIGMQMFYRGPTYILCIAFVGPAHDKQQIGSNEASGSMHVPGPGCMVLHKP